MIYSEKLEEKKNKTPVNNIGVPNSFYEVVESKEAYNDARYGVRAIPRGVRGGWSCEQGSVCQNKNSLCNV